MNDLTPRQLELLQIIHRFIKSGKSPSYLDLLKELKVRSTQTVRDILDPLERKGYINRKPNVARGIFLTYNAYRILEPSMNENLQYRNNENIIEVGGTSSQDIEKQELPRIFDTQKAKELGVNNTVSLEGSFVVVTQQISEFQKHGICKLPDNTTTVKGVSWESYHLQYSSQNYSSYEWHDGALNCLIEKSTFGFGKAPCGHTATIRISVQSSSCDSSDSKLFLLCDKFSDEVDMAEFNLSVVQGKALPPYTGDRCLGITCNYYYYLINN